MLQANASLEERKRFVEQRVADACQRAGRARQDVNMIAVTKYSTLADTLAIRELGMHHLGESRWQEAKPKWEHIGTAVDWHFIGHLQTNKVKDVVGKFAWLHSLDRMSLAEEVERVAANRNVRQTCFLQLNISGEESKYGLAPMETVEFAQAIRRFTHLRVVGLMTMAPYGVPAHEARAIFRELRAWRDRLNEMHLFAEPLRELSMGMSDDFEVAVEEGATFIRLGSILMGERQI